MSGGLADSGETATKIGVPVRSACFCVGIFFSLMLLFNGVSMYASGKLLEYGRERDFWVSVLSPIEQCSRLTGLFYLRQVTQDTVGKSLNQTSVK